MTWVLPGEVTGEVTEDQRVTWEKSPQLVGLPLALSLITVKNNFISNTL